MLQMVSLLLPDWSLASLQGSVVALLMPAPQLEGGPPMLPLPLRTTAAGTPGPLLRNWVATAAMLQKIRSPWCIGTREGTGGRASAPREPKAQSEQTAQGSTGAKRKNRTRPKKQVEKGRCPHNPFFFFFFF